MDYLLFHSQFWWNLDSLIRKPTSNSRHWLVCVSERASECVFFLFLVCWGSSFSSLSTPITKKGNVRNKLLIPFRIVTKEKRLLMQEVIFAKQVEEYGGPVFQSRCQEKKEKKIFYFTSLQWGEGVLVFFSFSLSLCVWVCRFGRFLGSPSTAFAVLSRLG